MKKSKEAIRDWLIKNAKNQYGEIELTGIDFGAASLKFNYVKARYIDNSYQYAKDGVCNDYQETKESIFNNDQKANYIDNGEQSASIISNGEQEGNEIGNWGQNAIKKIDNEDQNAAKIYN